MGPLVGLREAVEVAVVVVVVAAAVESHCLWEVGQQTGRELLHYHIHFCSPEQRMSPSPERGRTWLLHFGSAQLGPLEVL